MITLESFRNEINAEFYDIEMDLCLIQGTNVYTEAAQEAKKNIFQRAIEMIKGLIQKIKDKVQEVIQNHQLKKVEKLISENPELANKKIKVPNYDKLHKLNADTLDRLSDKNCDVEKEMSKYKKQRNILLGSAAALTTVTLGLAISLSKMKKTADKSVKLLEKSRESCAYFEKERDDALREYVKMNKEHGSANDILRDMVNNAKEESKKDKKALTDALRKNEEVTNELKKREMDIERIERDREHDRETRKIIDYFRDKDVDKAQRLLQSYDKNQKYHMHKINRNIDMAIKHVKSIQSISQSESNDLIRYLSNIFRHTQNMTSNTTSDRRDIDSIVKYMDIRLKTNEII